MAKTADDLIGSIIKTKLYFWEVFQLKLVILQRDYD